LLLHRLLGSPSSLASHIQIGYAVAIPACSFVINRRLNHITRISVAHKFKQDRIREFWIDVGIALGIPVFQMIIYIVPQGVRYQIYEDVGCATAVYNTWQAMLLVNAWPLAISCLSLGYVCQYLRRV
jgi:pheromone a factor receptor